MMVLGFTEYEQQGRLLATELGLPYQTAQVHRFPDRESRVTLPPQLPEWVVLCRSLDRPNEKLVELMLAAETARSLGARRVTLVTPYLCYMRQDKAFSPGEAISQVIVGRWLAALFDDVVTVDPHLHRVHRIADAVPANNAVALSATAVMSDFLCSKGECFLLGPDSESLQWVSRLAAGCGVDYAVADKQRLGDRQVVVQLPGVDLAGRNVVLVDDVVSSGETAAAAARGCLQRGAGKVDVLVTHPLFAEDAIERLREAGVADIWSTDSISHPSNRVQLAPLLARAVRELG